MIEVYSSGGGTQSNAIAAMIIQGLLPKPAFGVIADTGREMPTTWEYFENITKPALKAFGVEMYRAGQEYCSELDKTEFHGTEGTLLIPAFTNQSGNASKLSSFCSDKWKARVCNRFIKARFGLGRSEIRKWIGYSIDEPRRWSRMMKGEEYRSGLLRLPLVIDVPTKRHEAIRLVEKMGWPTPPRSRCWMCPNQSDMEWSEVQENHPHLWNQAVELDESIRERDAHAFLHSSITPLRSANLSAKDDLFSASCPSGECFI